MFFYLFAESTFFPTVIEHEFIMLLSFPAIWPWPTRTIVVVETGGDNFDGRTGVARLFALVHHVGVPSISLSAVFFPVIPLTLGILVFTIYGENTSVGTRVVAGKNPTKVPHFGKKSFLLSGTEGILKCIFSVGPLILCGTWPTYSNSCVGNLYLFHRSSRGLPTVSQWALKIHDFILIFAHES